MPILIPQSRRARQVMQASYGMLLVPAGRLASSGSSDQALQVARRMSDECAPEVSGPRLACFVVYLEARRNIPTGAKEPVHARKQSTSPSPGRPHLSAAAPHPLHRRRKAVSDQLLGGLGTADAGLDRAALHRVVYVQ